MIKRNTSSNYSNFQRKEALVLTVSSLSHNLSSYSYSSNSHSLNNYNKNNSNSNNNKIDHTFYKVLYYK